MATGEARAGGGDEGERAVDGEARLGQPIGGEKGERAATNTVSINVTGEKRT